MTEFKMKASIINFRIPNTSSLVKINGEEEYNDLSMDKERLNDLIKPHKYNKTIFLCITDDKSLIGYENHITAAPPSVNNIIGYIDTESLYDIDDGLVEVIFNIEAYYYHFAKIGKLEILLIPVYTQRGVPCGIANGYICKYNNENIELLGSSIVFNVKSQESVKTEKCKKYISWDQYFYGIAELSTMRSKDPSTQVGACIVKDNKIVSVGYNGFPRGISDDKYPWASKAKELKDCKDAYVVHAELNAILNCNRDLEGSTLYVTRCPCNECAKAIIQCGIKKVYFSNHKDNEKEKIALQMFDEVGIEYVEFESHIHITYDHNKQEDQFDRLFIGQVLNTSYILNRRNAKFLPIMKKEDCVYGLLSYNEIGIEKVDYSSFDKSELKFLPRKDFNRLASDKYYIEFTDVNLFDSDYVRKNYEVYTVFACDIRANFAIDIDKERKK